MGKRTDEYHQDIYDGPQVSEGFGGTILEQLCCVLVDPQLTPNLPVVVEDVTNPGGKGDIIHRYNLRPFQGRNI